MNFQQQKSGVIMNDEIKDKISQWTEKTYCG